MMRTWKGFCIIAVVTLSISGCGSSKTNTAPANSYIPTLEASTIVNGDAATLRITTDLKLSKEHYDQQRKQGEGHVHVSLDKAEKEIMTTTEKNYEHLSKGPHELKVSLHNNDHTPYDVSKTITFEVK